MTELEVIRWALTLTIGVLGYLMKRNLETVEGRITKVEADLENIRVNYLHKDDFKEFKMELKSMFEEIKADIRLIRDNK